MSQATNHNNQHDQSQADVCCPLCFFMKGLKETRSKHSEFYTHMFNAQIEFLQAVKSLLDNRISSLEQKRDEVKEKESKKATKIKVE